MPHAVIQRGKSGMAPIPVAGSTEAADGATVEVRVGRRGPWTGVGAVKSGGFSAATEPLPTGGPYEVSVRVGRETATVRDLLVGDLFLLAGQSNMDGCGKLVEVEPPSRRVRCFYYDDRWDIAEDPLCRYNEAVDPVHWGVPEEDVVRMAQWERDFRVFGAGLGVRFGKEVHRRQGVPVGLLACSHGGTSLEQWSPSLVGQGGRSLYGSLIRRVKAVGARVAACLWYQGESDAATEAGRQYRANMGAFIQALRRDLAQPRLPFLQVQLGPFFGEAAGFPHWNKVQTDQIAVEDDLPHVATVAAVDLDLSDAIHLSTRSERLLGVRLAHLADRLVYGDRSAEIGPRFRSVRASRDRRTVAVRFAGVNGSLTPRSGLQGFNLDANGAPVPIPGREVQDARTVVLRLRDPLPEGAVLWYGQGPNPVVNLRDQAGLPCPVFGPVAL